jgi:high-affinity K+ transport system ATPase subunit B
MNTQTHVNSHKKTMAVPNFEVWKNAFVKLLPQHAIKNPVMAIVWLGTVVTGISTILGYTTLLFGLVVTAILFITILFANYAEAVAGPEVVDGHLHYVQQEKFNGSKTQLFDRPSSDSLQRPNFI